MSELAHPGPTCSVIGLALVVGVGTRGVEGLKRVPEVLEWSSESLRLSTATWDPAAASGSGSAILDGLLSAENLDRLRRLGYVFPELNVGQAIRPVVVILADIDDSASATVVDAVFPELKKSVAKCQYVGLLLTSSGVDAAMAWTPARRPEWTCFIPALENTATSGRRSPCDLALHAAQTATMIADRAHSGLGSRLLGGTAAAPGYTPVAQVGAAYLAHDQSRLVSQLDGPMAAEILRLNFRNVAPYEPAGAFDSAGETRFPASSTPLDMASSLLVDTPFSLETPVGEPWRIHLATGEVGAEFGRSLPRRWPSILRRTADFIDSSRASVWRETVEGNQQRLESARRTLIETDVSALHHHTRGPDRVLVWAAKSAEALEQPIEIARPANSDFEAAMEKLKTEIAKAPSTLARVARVGLVGLLAAEALRRGTLLLLSPVWACGAFALTLAATAVWAATIWDRAHRRLIDARDESERSLKARFERQMRDKLAACLADLRTKLGTALASARDQSLVEAKDALDRADELDQPPAATDDHLVYIERVLAPEDASSIRTKLNPPYEWLQREAAERAALIPAGQNPSMSGTAAAVLKLVREWLASQVQTLGIDYALETRMKRLQEDFPAIAATLQSRAFAMGPHGICSRFWLAPSSVTAQLQAAVDELEPGDSVLTHEGDFLACISFRVEPKGAKR